MDQPSDKERAMEITAKEVRVPLDVPDYSKAAYIDNYLAATKNTGRLMLFAGDQKVEHLNEDFFGPGIHPDDADPEHLFRIAARGKIGVFAAQVGLIAAYGMDYPEVDYLVKINSKTNLVPTSHKDPLSLTWTEVDRVVEFREMSGLKVRGIGFTCYLGSEFEAVMLKEAADAVCEAHRNGLIAVLWMYPRGKAVADEKDPGLIAGAAGAAACLGADFAKVNYPEKEGHSSAEIFREAILAAGRTGVVCAGGATMDVGDFLNTLHEQIHVSGARGNATGRNIHQRSLDEAVRMCDAVFALTCENSTVDRAGEIFETGA